MISGRFIKHSFIYTVAGSLPMASAILLMPFYGHFLSTEVFGLLSVYFAVSLLVQIFVTYSFDASIYVYYHEHKHDEQKLATFISSVFIFILGVSVIVSVLLSLTGYWLFEFIFGKEDVFSYPFGILSVATGVLQAVFKVNNSLLQTSEKATQFLKTNLFSFSLIASLTIAGLFLYPNSLWGPIGGKVIGAFISFSWVLYGIVKKYGIQFNWTLIKETFSFNHPSLIYQIQQWFINYYDRIIILMLLSKSTVGYYDLAAKCLLAIDFILAGLNTTFFPKVLSIVKEQKIKASTIEINRYYHGLTAVAMLLVATSIFVFPYLIDFFFPKSYLPAIGLIPLLAILYLIRPLRLYLAMPFAAIKYSKPLPAIYLVIAILKISLLFYFIPIVGIEGAVLATIISCIVEIILLYIFINKKFTIKMNANKLLWSPLSLITLIVALKLTNFIPEMISYILLFIFTFIMLLFVYRKELAQLYQTTVKKLS
ncbi:MAG: oligosaccharide flippase family protein [Cyclobacteriaceae bacterium]|nr:oligosaccharide flippase family protein [Cytophagales bacterium]MCZ8326839.1 oligosaccharide flippase family protein [Cyclobacteriaceae bacterium]